MPLVIVPGSLDRAIEEKLDEAYEDCPEAKVDREAHHQTLLTYFYEHGVLPTFSLKKAEPEPTEEEKKDERTNND